MYSNILSANMMVLRLSFPICILSFILLLWLLWGLPKLYWIRVIRVVIHVLFLIIGEMGLFFTIEYDTYCQFVVYGFYYVKGCSMPVFWRIFIINGCWILEPFLHLLWLSYDVLFYLVICCITLIDLCILEEFLHL